MKQTENIPFDVRLCVPFAGWIARHPKLTNAVLIAMGMAMVWVVLNYEFTTRI